MSGSEKEWRSLGVVTEERSGSFAFLAHGSSVNPLHLSFCNPNLLIYGVFMQDYAPVSLFLIVGSCNDLCVLFC